MGRLTDYVIAKQIQNLSGEERREFLHKINEQRMREVREKLRAKENERELKKIIEEVFADIPEKDSDGTITLFLADDVLNS